MRIELKTTFGNPFKTDGDVYAVFAVHQTICGEPGQFNLSHLPTGFAILERVSQADATTAAMELIASGRDWSTVHQQEDLTADHKAQGRDLRVKYPSDPVIHRQRRKVEPND